MARRGQVSIDSSVAVKWFSEEEKTSEAVSLRDAHVDGRLRLLSTSLLGVEVANALRYKPGYDYQKLETAIENLYKLHLHEVPIGSQLLLTAGDIAFKCDLTVYDAVPVAVAALMKTECITADEETQYSRTRRKGYPVELL